MSGTPDPDLADVDTITFANLERHDQRPRVCPDWRKEDITSNGLYRLTNDVHPVFEASRFIGARFSLEDTQQARRFASRLLEADCCMPFWWALMFGKTTKDPGLQLREAKAANIRMLTNEKARVSPQEVEIAVRSLRQARDPHHELCVKDPSTSAAALTLSQINTTKAALQGMAREIHYVVEMDAVGSRCDTNWLRRANAPSQGSPSTIVISAQELRALSATMEQGDLVCQVWASISLGFRLLQLLAHAAVGATRSGAQCNWSNKYSFSPVLTISAQIRMLESCTFGGVLRREQEQEQVAKSHYTINGAEGVPGLWFAFSDYPSEPLSAMTGENPPGHYLADADVGEDGPFYHREWQVSFSWLLRLLTDTFWNNDVRTRGQAALAPPREVGYVMHRDNKRKYGPLHSEHVRRRGIVPRGYRMLPCSYVMARKSLQHDGRAHMIFGGFDVGRIAFDSDDEMYREDDSESEGNGSESSGSGMDEDVSDSANDGDNDIDNDSDSDMDMDMDSDVDMHSENDSASN